jgi:fatty-acyl-CoA synthase
MDNSKALESVERQVLDVVRQLALELGGDRAGRASAAASLEREVGLGSLERVELLARLETATGRTLGEHLLTLDSAAEIAQAIVEAKPAADRRPSPTSATPDPTPSAAMPQAATIHEALWRRAEAESDRVTVRLLEDDRSEALSYGRLLSEARLAAGGLSELGIEKGDRVALMLPTGRPFLSTFQGILLAGAVPVPIYPPVRLDRLEDYVKRQSAILRDAGARLLLTVAIGRPLAERLRPRVPSLARIATPAELIKLDAPWPGMQGRGSDPALVQYTSGSTGAPKGVLLTHESLLANIRAIGKGVSLRPVDIGVSWLPLYHDMGLIGTWLFCLVMGIPLTLLSPLAFLARPERWLWALCESRGTLSAAPNFAYELCVRRIPDSALAGLDLSSWRLALNGAEPVNPGTLDRFSRRFADYGFRPEAMLPVYGLAESSVALCFPPLGRGPRVDRVSRPEFERSGRAEAAPDPDRTALRFVSAGRPLPEHEVRIVDETGHVLPERRVGRLVFRGPSSMHGYLGQPEATEAIRLADGFLDSGDLAYLADGEVYVTGRHKDLIIKGGRNLVPQEIEEVASEVRGIRKGCVVALGVADESLGTERLVVVAETRAKGEEAQQALRAAVIQGVVEAVGVPPDIVALVPPRSVPKTSSGKIQRAATRELYLAGRLGQPEGGRLAAVLPLLVATLRSAARTTLRGVGQLLYVSYVAGLLGLLGAVAWPVAALLRSPAALGRLCRGAARLVLRAIGCRLQAEGLERLPRQGPFLLVCNHASYVDVLALLALLPIEFLFVAKREVTRWPLIGLFVRRLGHLTVERFDARQSVADAVGLPEAIGAGHNVLVFPEGTFTASTGLRPFRLGAFKAAVETQVPVLPLALRGTRRVLRGDRLVPHPGPIDLFVGEPLVPQGTGWHAVVDLRDRAAARIADRCGEPRLAVAPSVSEP